MTGWTIFVARRMLASDRSRGGGAARLAMLGVAAGVATLVVVLAVMNGFQAGTIESILEVNSFHIRVESDRTVAERSRVATTLESISAVPGVAVATPFAEFQTLARGSWPQPQGVVVRAVADDWPRSDPAADARLRTISGAFALEATGTIVLGTELARALGVAVGETVAVSYLPAGGGAPREAELTVRGTARTGYLDIDRGWAFVSLETAAALLAAEEPLTIGVKLDNRFADAAVAARITEVLGDQSRVERWRSYNRGIFGALRVEKSMMVLLIGLIFVVVAGNLYQLLRRSVLERSEEIAILRALGAHARRLERVVVFEGLLVGLSGVLFGNLFGLFVASRVNEIFAVLERASRLLVNRGIRVFSPAYFYLLEVPVRIVPSEIVAISFGALSICVTAALFASATVTRHRPMELLRNE